MKESQLLLEMFSKTEQGEEILWFLSKNFPPIFPQCFSLAKPTQVQKARKPGRGFSLQYRTEQRKSGNGSESKQGNAGHTQIRGQFKLFFPLSFPFSSPLSHFSTVVYSPNSQGVDPEWDENKDLFTASSLLLAWNTLCSTAVFPLNSIFIKINKTIFNQELFFQQQRVKLKTF